MIAKLLRFALRQRFIILALGVLLIGLGIWAFRQLKIEAYPDISDTQVTIITTYPGRAAEEVEQQITIPIERVMNSAPRVIARRSRTIFGLSVVELTFAYGTDDYFARQVALERLRDAELPDGVTPGLGPLATPIGELYRYTVDGQGYTALQLRELQDWVIAPLFLQVPGVADVVPFGGLIKQYQIEVDPYALEKYKLSIRDVVEAVKAGNQNAGGGVLDNRQQALVLRGVGLAQTTRDIEYIVISEAGGVPVFVKDVGRVSIGGAPRTGIFGLEQKSGGVEGIVLLRRGENPTEVLEHVHEKVEELNTSRLPHGVALKPIYDRTELVDNTLHTVTHTLLEGLVIVVTVLFVFLGSVRAAVLTAVTIPLSLLFAFVCMHFSGIPANLLSLGALDFGIIVDGTLVMVEHIVHTLGEQREKNPQGTVLAAIRDAALEVESPIFFSLLIIIAAYLPLFTLERVERRLFTPMAFTLCYALIGSLLMALTLIPVLATYLFRHGAKSWDNPVLQWLAARYGSLLQLGLRRPWAVVSIAAGIVVATFLPASFLGSEFLPQLDEGTIWIRANLPAGISLDKSAEIANRIRAVVTQFPEVRLTASQTGRNDAGTDPFGPNRNELLVTLQPYDSWKSGWNKADLVEALSRKLREEIPGAQLNFTQPIIDTVTESVTGSSADLAVIITGPDLKQLRALADQGMRVIPAIRGAADTAIEQEPEQVQLRVQLSREAAARFGIRIADVQQMIEAAIGGQAASTLFEGERRFDITVRLVPEARATASAIGQMLVPTRAGGRVPLASIAEIGAVNGATIIGRRENRRQITVRTNIRGRDQGSFVKEAQRRFASAVKLPPGYQVEWGGQYENLDRARRRLTVILPITIALIFTILFFAFGSTRWAGLVLLNVPFSLVGGILFLWIRGINLSVSAAVGFISLFGVAVMSGVLIVAEINRMRQEGGLELKDAVVSGCLKQLRPVLMMVLVALLGMVPAARASGIGSDVQRPLATVVVGGLLSTLLLTLLALPSLYYLMARSQQGEA